MKQLYYGFWVLILFAGLLTSAKSQSLAFPEKDFATPEAALQHFVESMAKNDVMSALQAFAINPQAEKFDFTAMSERLGVIQTFQLLSPNEYLMYRELNRLELVSRYAQQIKLFSYSFFLQITESFEAIDPYEAILIQDEPGLIAEFVTTVNPEKLAALTLNKVFRIVATSEKMLDVWQQQATPVGADEVTELVVLYELEGNYYLGGARVLRYGESWKLDGLNSTLAGTDATGNVTLTTQEEFETLISELGNNDNWRLEQIQ